MSRVVTRRFLARHLAIAALCGACAWVVARHGVDERIQRSVDRETQRAERAADGIAADLAQMVDHFRGLPLILAKIDAVREAAAHPSPALRERARTGEGEPEPVDRVLEAAARDTGADVIWMLDAVGTCIASSNAANAMTTVGMSFAGREYYMQTRKGLVASQYSVGKSTAGLVYAAPVLDHGRVVGTIAVKKRMGKLSHVLDRADALLVDPYGVVILARARALEMRALPGGAVQALSPEARQERYGRTSFPVLRLAPAHDDRVPAALRFEDDAVPVALVTRPLPRDGMEVYVVARLGAIGRLDRFGWTFGLLWAAAVAVALAIDAAATSLLTRRRRRAASSRHSTSPERPAPPDAPAVDEHWLAEVTDMTGGATRALLDVYVDTVADQLRALARSVSSGDADAVALVAHSIKGASRNLGLTGMGDRAEALEGRARQQPPAIDDGACAPIEEEFRRVVRWVRRTGDGAPAVL